MSSINSSDSHASPATSSPVLRKALTDFAAGTISGIAGKIVECVLFSALPFFASTPLHLTIRVGIRSTPSRSDFKRSVRLPLPLLPPALRFRGRWTAL